MTLSHLACKIHATTFADLPADALSSARLHLLDAIGVALASAGTGAGKPYLEAAAALGSAGSASILVLRVTRDAATVALLNSARLRALLASARADSCSGAK
jgi:2-methylcitrate dehydratase PrpD